MIARFQFYSQVLAAPVRKETFGDFAFGLLPHAESNASGCLMSTPGNQPSTTGPLIYLSVEGRLKEAVETAAAKGGSVVIAPHPIGEHGYRAVIIDSEGNKIALHSH